MNKIKIYVDGDGSVIVMFSPKEWADYINEFVEERAYILCRKKVSPRKRRSG